MMKKKESWQSGILASAISNSESDCCFTATASTTKHEFCMMWLKIISFSALWKIQIKDIFIDSAVLTFEMSAAKRDEDQQT